MRCNCKIGNGPGDVCEVHRLRTNGGEGTRGRYWQRELGRVSRFACLDHVNGFLPLDAAACALAAQVVSRREVAESGNKVIDREIELKFGRKVGANACQKVGGARCERNDGFGAKLSEHAELLTIRVLDIESPEERIEPIAELLIGNGVAYKIRTTHILGFVCTEPGEEETRPAIARAAAHFKKVFGFFDERADAYTGSFGVALPICRFEEKVAILLVPFGWRRRDTRRRST